MISQFDKIKYSLQRKDPNALIQIIRQESCDESGGMKYEIAAELWRVFERFDVDLSVFGFAAFKSAKTFQRIYAQDLGQKVLDNIEKLEKPILVEIAAFTRFLSLPPIPEFNMKRWLRDYWHGKRKPRAYPSGYG